MKLLVMFLLISSPCFALEIPQGVIISTGSAVKTNFTTAAPFSLPSDKPIRVQCTEDAWVSLYATDVPAVGPGVSVYLPANAFYTTNTVTGTRNVAIKPAGSSATCTVFWVTGPVYTALSGSGGGTATGGICTLEEAETAVTSAYRATTTISPGYECDAALSPCVKVGPGTQTGIGLDELGRMYFGYLTGGGEVQGTSRFGFGEFSNGVRSNGPISIYNNGYLFNEIGGAVPVDDADGFQVKCKTSLPSSACSTLTESTTLDICGTGGALTKRCSCLCDGTTCAWRNQYNLAAGAGTTTTCPTT